MKEIYYYIVIIGLLLGAVMPQHGYQRRYYIGLMAVIHAFVCGFRYKFLTGDLLKYNTEYQDVRWFAYLSERVIHEWKNTGFYWLMKFLSDLTLGNFQTLLIVTAVIVEVAVAILIYRYSTRPWLSYLVWNCMGFYIFGFSAVKQSLAMALLMFAMIGIFEEKPKQFLVWTVLAGFIHMPAFAFLPAYWIAKKRIRISTIAIYIAAAVLIFAFKGPIVTFITDFYYEEDEFSLLTDAALGGRFFVMIVILVCGIVIKGFGDRKFEKLFNILVVAAILQMFSGYDNIFTRFADYYFQFSILFFPMMFSSRKTDTRLASTNSKAILPLNERSLNFFALVLMVVLVWYYHYTCLARPIDYTINDYLNFSFMWSK